MRRRPSWFGRYDDAILELLEDSEMAAPPAVVEFNLKWRDIASPAYSTVRRRMRVLEEHGLLDKVNEEKGYYAISKRGKKYLAGDYDASELEDDNE